MKLLNKFLCFAWGHVYGYKIKIVYAGIPMKLESDMLICKHCGRLKDDNQS